MKGNPRGKQGLPAVALALVALVALDNYSGGYLHAGVAQRVIESSRPSEESLSACER